jgi:hypothetical protein
VTLPDAVDCFVEMHYWLILSAAAGALLADGGALIFGRTTAFKSGTSKAQPDISSCSHPEICVPMKARYVTVWKLHGANTLAAANNDVELARLSDPTVVVRITAGPEPYFVRIDEAAAIANLLINGLTGVFGGYQGLTFEQAFAAELAKVKSYRSNQTLSGVFVILEGETEVSSPNFRLRKDDERFGVCFDAVNKSEIMELFRPSIQTILTAIALSLSANADREMERLGGVIYLVEPDHPKPIYTFTPEFGAPKLSLASPITDAVLSNVAKRIPKLGAEKALGRPISLLTTSLDRGTDELEAFIAAWSALEIFVNGAFKTTYELRWFDIMQSGAPISAKPVFQRFKDVMCDKYRLADKFLIIASVLDSDSAPNDAEIFRNLKSVRDNLSHGLETPTHLPREAVQNLLFKLSTPQQRCIGWPEQKYIIDAGKKAAGPGCLSSDIRLGWDYAAKLSNTGMGTRKFRRA